MFRFEVSPLVEFETGKDSTDLFGIMYVYTDAEGLEETDWVTDAEDLSEAQAQRLADWATTEFANATQFDVQAIDMMAAAIAAEGT